MMIARLKDLFIGLSSITLHTKNIRPERKIIIYIFFGIPVRAIPFEILNFYSDLDIDWPTGLSQGDRYFTLFDSLCDGKVFSV